MSKDSQPETLENPGFITKPVIAVKTKGYHTYTCRSCKSAKKNNIEYKSPGRKFVDNCENNSLFMKK